MITKMSQWLSNDGVLLVFLLALVILLLSVSGYLSFQQGYSSDGDSVKAVPKTPLEITTKPVEGHPGNFLVWEVGVGDGKRFLLGILALENGREAFISSQKKFVTSLDQIRCLNLSSGHWQFVMENNRSFLFEPKTGQFFFEEDEG